MLSHLPAQAIKVFEISKKGDIRGGFVTQNFDITKDHVLKYNNDQDTNNGCAPHFISVDGLGSW